MNKSVFVSILSVLLLLLISSCNKEIKEEEFPNYIVHTIDITGDQTWSGDTHLIQGTVVLNDLILTIEPGCIVLFDIDAELIIGDSLPTAIIANGTEEEPIIFTSVNKEDALPGDWEYVKFMENTDASTSLNHCKFLYGGGNFSDIGIIHLSDCHISVENCEFAYSTHYGVTLGDGAYFDNFKNNTIRDCQSYAIKTEAKSVTSFERSNTIESDSGIFITDEYFKERDITWINHGVPYSFNDDFIIGAPGGSKLRLEPGTVVRMGRNGSINVGLSQDEPGTLIAAGTETEPIVFTSENSLKSPGDWKYLWFDEGASSSTKLEYCLIEYGGGYTENTGMVEIRNCKINMDNCTIKRSKQYGINAYIEGGFESFSGNTVEFNNNYPIRIKANHLHTLGYNNFVDTNTVIMVEEDDIEGLDKTWKKQTCPYLINGIIDIEDADSCTLTILGGIELQLVNNSTITVGYTDKKYGRLVANGVTFTSAQKDSKAGDWDYIAFGPNTLSGSILNDCKILYGGGGTSENFSYGAVYIKQNDNTTVSNCEIGFSKGNGITIVQSDATIENNNFHDIALKDIVTVSSK